MTKIVGLVGFIGSGKGTVADILCEKYGYKKMAFADVLKDTTATMFGWPRHLLEGDTEESRIFRETVDEFWSEKLDRQITPRYVLQKLGTEASRDVFGNDIWISSLEKRIRALPLKSKIAITDVRFPNELKFVESFDDGITLRVVRGEEPIWYQTALKENTEGARGLMKEKHPSIHLSEWAWIGHDFDAIIENNGTLKNLKTSVKELVDTFDLS